MMNKIQFTAFALSAIFVFSSFKPDKPSYLLFGKGAEKVKFKTMIKELEEANVVLFGESHDNPISHWLQLEVTKDLFDSAQNRLILGAEMFETDNQVLLDEYLNGAITQSNFESEARLWPNYKTEYKPLVEFAKAQAIKDATMAHFILKNWSEGKLFLHFHGSYHSESYESIYWYLKQFNPDLKIVTIHTVSQKDVSKLLDENKGKADFTICVDEDMTKTK